MTTSNREALQMVRFRIRLYREAGCTHHEAVRRAIANTDGLPR
jgi:hypothetical protein